MKSEPFTQKFGHAQICSLSFTVKVFPKVCKPKLMLDAFRKRALCAVLSILGCGMRRR